MRGRVAFLSPRELGELGTTGTYRIIDEVAKYHEVRVFSLGWTHRCVHWWQNVPLIPVVAPLSPQSLNSVLPSICAFDPDVVYVFNSAKWEALVEKIKLELPATKVTFDIQTPVLTDDLRLLKARQESGDIALPLLDRIISHSEASVKTWFGRPVSADCVLPPGIDLSSFCTRRKHRAEWSSSDHCALDFVYAASLHEKRNGADLIKGFKKFIEERPGAAILHIYGGGPDRENLEAQALEASLDGSVVFHGMVSQSDLYKAFSEMDAAIGWVPKKLYDQSPSLKVLEYMAAGLPVLATSTTAHRSMEKEGFTLDFCEDTPESLAQGLCRWLEHGFDEERIRQNRKAVEARDYPRLVRERLLPVLDELLDECNRISVPQKKEPWVAGSRDLGSVPADGPLRILFVMSTLGIGAVQADHSPPVRPEAVDLAEALAARGNRVYLTYPEQGPLRFEVDERVVLFPHDDRQALETLVKGGRLDVMVAFSFDDRSLIPIARLADRYRVPLVVHDPPATERARSESDYESGRSRARACWEQEMFFSLAVRRSGHLGGFDPQQSLGEWESLLRQAATVTGEFQGLGQEQEVIDIDYERALHVRRVRQRVLDG